MVQNASESHDFWRILEISGELRRILDQPPGGPPKRPATQTHFGPHAHQCG
ncbi:hypothetical protein HMPREF1550_00610 [Actinomyces sp. oral taxon 877 str. F0543]|nr:hypothetical protein HMPREF1550_00610 [Actinomyces sp. oral taxon 877 str. F0543]